MRKKLWRLENTYWEPQDRALTSWSMAIACSARWTTHARAFFVRSFGIVQTRFASLPSKSKFRPLRLDELALANHRDDQQVNRFVRRSRILRASISGIVG